ncbi:MAG: 50S ribosomal protein L2 [Candidatus Blackburnbacteria bacterium]|nr:50S ribosomal protein L2 [Candidatus Blackburnbacteria bacterium]
MRRLRRILKKKSGRGFLGHVAVRHQGGRQKRFLREVDFVRAKRGVPATVEGIEYDPNRTARLARLLYDDGERGYILAPEGMAVGEKIEAGDSALIKPGNALPLSMIPVGTLIHNIELRPGKGGQFVRGTGTAAVVQGKEESWVLVKLPSGEIRRFPQAAYATIGQVVRVERKRLGKAGRRRHMGIRPRVRGTAMHPGAHPHGGGEGRSGEGMPPKTPWGKPARGVKTRKPKKYSDGLIAKKRKIGYGAR